MHEIQWITKCHKIRHIVVNLLKIENKEMLFSHWGECEGLFPSSLQEGHCPFKEILGQQP